ncbi:flagellar motor switch protein FliM [uncultured Fretibacterium sp.]|uniref:flagellar motor switch protein FliM n=1 Tax=uncultured Fretibacterium sp. TaxID=1678694 RepID=UPI00263584C9|nr:flagellar motor switch protein FliM [uncultured Fretibacterium sp.]
MLSQSEIDSLLNALTSGNVDIDSMAEKADERNLKVYDFKRPDKFSKDQLRAIQMIHEAFARQLTTVMSTLIRSIVSAEVASVDQLAYEEFLNSLVQPTVIGMIEMHPFDGNMLLEINPNLVFAIIDRMLGGKGNFTGKLRELTDIEKTVIERVLMRMLELLEDSWSTVVDVRFRFESMESNPFFVQICSPRDMVLLVILKLKVGDLEGMMSLCFPYFLMEPIVDKLSSQQWFAATKHERDEEEQRNLLSSMHRVKVPLALELGHTILSLSDVYALQAGDVIKLDETKDSDVAVRVGNRVSFMAKPGTVEGRLAVELTRILKRSTDESSEGEEKDG